MKKGGIFLFLFWNIIAVGLLANNNDTDKLFKNYFFTNDMESWELLVDSITASNPGTIDEKIELLYGHYGLVAGLIGNDQKGKAMEKLEIFDDTIEQFLDDYPDNGVLYAFKAASVAFRIVLQPIRAPFLSSSHLKYVEKAIDLCGEKGLPLTERANSYYFRPNLFGGDKSEAVEAYRKAFYYYKENAPDHWMYYNTGAWYGNSLVSVGEKEAAAEIYKMLLKEEPTFEWVRDELIPALDDGSVINFFDSKDFTH
ncbi:hypothetical protein QA597_05820 [Marinilabiliaceae bacterium ANBcel2]|nr:hypothetical protein [Marinilabiliaceae bacterium ANBcel2]